MTKAQKDRMDRFLSSVGGYCVVFGLTNYDVVVRAIDEPGYHAMLDCDSDNCTAVFYYNYVEDETPEDTALHEVLHLLLARYRDLARYRFVDERSLDVAEESIVRTLSKIFTNLKLL